MVVEFFEVVVGGCRSFLLLVTTALAPLLGEMRRLGRHFVNFWQREEPVSISDQA